MRKNRNRSGLCSKCSNPLDGAYPNVCCSCSAAYQREWYKKNRLKEIERVKKYNKANPEKLARNMRISRDRDPNYKEKFKAWRLANKDRVSLYDKNKRAKRRQACGKITKNEWESILCRHGHKCFYCGSDGKMTIDHFIPLISGGENKISNVVPACLSCNCRKSDCDPIEFIKNGLRRYYERV